MSSFINSISKNMQVKTQNDNTLNIVMKNGEAYYDAEISKTASMAGLGFSGAFAVGSAGIAIASSMPVVAALSTVAVVSAGFGAFAAGVVTAPAAIEKVKRVLSGDDTEMTLQKLSDEVISRLTEEDQIKFKNEFNQYKEEFSQLSKSTFDQAEQQEFSQEELRL